MVAVYERNYKLIHNLGNNKSLLFNIQNDPDEEMDTIDKEPAVSQRLLRLILHKVQEVNRAFIERQAREHPPYRRYPVAAAPHIKKNILPGLIPSDFIEKFIQGSRPHGP
jgi:arylsulfatase A-like enzyme